MNWLSKISGKSSEWWFGDNSIYGQLMPNEQSISVGGVELTTKRKSTSYTVNVINENNGVQIPDGLKEFFEREDVKKYLPYVLAYIIIRRI